MLFAEVNLPGATSSVPAARRFIESLLAAWDQPELGWAAALCVSELSGNCALHARTRFTVRVSLDGDVVRLEVSDGSFRAPAQRTYGPDSTTGRGLRLVEEFASSWGVEMTANGKTVWAVLRAEPPQAAALREESRAPDLEVLPGCLGDDGDQPRVSTRGTWWRQAAA